MLLTSYCNTQYCSNRFKIGGVAPTLFCEIKMHNPVFKCLHVREIPSQPHASMENVRIQRLLSEESDSAPVTCAIVHIPAGSQPEKHIHEHSEDILYVLAGRGMFWIAGEVFPVTPGTFVRVPKGVLHAPFEIQEDLTLYNI